METKPKTPFKIVRPQASDIDEFIRLHAKSWVEAYPNAQEGVSRAYIEEHVKRFSSNEGRARKLGFEIVNGSEHMHRDTILPVVGMVRKGDKV